MPKRMIYPVAAIVLLFLIGCGDDNGTQSDAPSTWETNLGGASFERALRVAVSSDGGYVVAGNVGNGSSADVHIIKVDRAGETVWEHTIGGANEERMWSMQPTSDGGYVIAGLTSSMGYGGNDAYLLKVRPDGTSEFERAYGTSQNDDGVFAHQTPAGGFVMIGSSMDVDGASSTIVAYRMSSTGAMLDRMGYGGDTLDVVSAGARTRDGGSIIVVLRPLPSAPSPEIRFLKFDAAGVVAWQNSYGGQKPVTPNGITETVDGGFVIVGEVEPAGRSDKDAYLAKADATGSLVWEKAFGSDKDDALNAVRETPDGGLIMTGSTQAKLIQGTDVYLVKTNASGEIIWERTFGGQSNDEAYDVAVTGDSGYVIVGRTASFGTGGGDFYVLRTDANGEL